MGMLANWTRMQETADESDTGGKWELQNILAVTIERILQNIAPKDVLSHKIQGAHIAWKRLKEICFMEEDQLSEPASEKRMDYLVNWVEQQLRELRPEVPIAESACASEFGIGFFDLTDCFALGALTFSDGELHCRYEHLN